MKCIPHRYPFLLIDKITNLDKDNGVIEAIKSVTINEPFFSGHFPSFPIMPGVLTIETMAQASAILAIKKFDIDLANLEVRLLSIEDARFRNAVLPGERIIIKSKLIKNKSNIYKFDCSAHLSSGELASEANITAGLFPKKI